MTQKNLNIVIFAHSLILLSCIKTINKDATSQAVKYGVEGKELPLSWALAGTTKAACSQQLSVPQNVVNDLNTAWTRANTLLATPMEMLVQQSGGNFFLNKVSLVVSSERVLVFSGCIGGKTESGTSPLPASRSEPSSVQMTPVASEGGGITSTCEELSDIILNLKKRDISRPVTDCGNPALSAGFAMRSSARDVSLTAYFLINGSAMTYSMKEFEINTLELSGGGTASISSFGAAILPLPGPVKAAATAVLDRVGAASFSLLFGTTKTVIPDNAYRKINQPSSDGTTRVSKLAENIARSILKPACLDAAKKLGIVEPRQCEIGSLSNTFGSAEALEKYRSMTVVNCESRGMTEKYLYALAHKPDTGAGETDFLVHTGSNPSKLFVYHQERGPVGTYVKKSWATYLGPSQDPKKHCGNFDTERYRCIAVLSGPMNDGGLICGQGIKRKLSLLSTDKID